MVDFAFHALADVGEAEDEIFSLVDEVRGGLDDGAVVFEVVDFFGDERHGHLRFELVDTVFEVASVESRDAVLFVSRVQLLHYLVEHRLAYQRQLGLHL